MKIRIVKAGASTYWYSDKIGEVFDVTGTDHPTCSGYSVQYDGECSKYYVNSDDCEIENEEADEMGVIEKMQAEIEKLKSKVAALEGSKSIREAGERTFREMTEGKPPLLLKSNCDFGELHGDFGVIREINLKKSPQQIRDEIVAKAKEDVEGLKCPGHLSKKSWEYRENLDGFSSLSKGSGAAYNCEYIVNKEKRIVVALLRGYLVGDVCKRGIAKTDPSDCFNSHIGKAIALRRALGIEIPAEYYNAPAPTEVRVGDVVGTTIGCYTVIEDEDFKRFRRPSKKKCALSSRIAREGKIVDDSRSEEERSG